MSKKDKVINNPDENADAKKIQKWSVWTQGPKDAKETQRKFKLTTPGQERDYKKLVSKRRFQRFEQIESVKPKKEEAPVNSVAGGGVDMAPNAGPPSKTTKVFMKRRRNPRVDGRTKAYRETVKRIKERHLKNAKREIEQRYSQFATAANPFREEIEMSNKYLTSKEGSLEQAVLQSVQTETTPISEKETLTLPKGYLEQKEGSLEYAAIKAIAEAPTHAPGAEGLATRRHKIPRQLKDPKKEKMVGTKSGTKVVDRNDPRYKNHPEHEELELEATTVQQKKGEKHEKGDKHDEAPDKKAGESDKDWKDRTAGRVSFKSHRKSLDKVDPDELRGKHKDRDDKDIDNDGDSDKSDQYLHRRRQAIATAHKKKQNLRDRDDEAQATRSKTRPTAESMGAAVKDRAATDAAIAAWKKKGGKVTKVPSRDRTDREKQVAQRSGFGQGPGIMGDSERAKPKRAHEEVEITEKEVDVKDTRRTVDAIRAYYRSKDESRDATSDTDKGKKAKGDKEKAYAKKERGEIKKDDPNWKHRKYHTGIHGEKWDPSLANKDDHATALYKDQWRDRSRADWDKAHGKDAMAKQDRADAGEDRKRMKEIDPNWKHAKYETGEKQNGPREAHEIGTDEYAEYTRDMTPGQPKEPAVAIDNKQAKKNDLIQKAANHIKKHYATKIDDAYDRSPDQSGGKPVQTPDTIGGVKVQKLKPSLKGMSKSGKMMHKMRHQNLRDRDNEAQATRSKKHPTSA